MELILTGERIDAARALGLGLINKVIDDEDFEKEVYEFAKRVAKVCSPIALGIAKQMVNYGSEVPLDIGLEMEAYGQGIAFSTEDFQEGVMAFMQKREAEFKNK
jgi:enoyl-CoA hydratase/3-hydroxyacyl-CoA dehydrogenase